MKSIKIGVALLCFAFFSNVSAFGQNRHEFSIWGAGGMSSLQYKTTYGHQKNGFGGNAGLGYTYFFSEHFGLGTGAEVALYNAKMEMDGLLDPALSKFEEKQKAYYINVPLMFQYQSKGHHKFYAAVGGKIGFPVSSKYKVSDVETSSSTFENLEGTKDDLDLKIAYMSSVEAGVKWRLGASTALYTGVYFDYGFNDVSDSNHDKSLLNAETGRSNSIIDSKYTRDGVGKSFTDKVNLIAVGLKIKLAFGSNPINHIVPVEIIPTTRPITEISTTVNADAEARRLAAEREAREAAERKAKQEQAERDAKLAAEREAAKIIENQERVAIHTVVDHFELGKSKLTPRMKGIIDTKIDAIKQHPNWKLVCVSHTCDIGTPAANAKMSDARAEAVKKHLIEKGIPASRITIDSEGETNPLVPNTTNANRLKNRRVEIVATEMVQVVR